MAFNVMEDVPVLVHYYGIIRKEDEGRQNANVDNGNYNVMVMDVDEVMDNYDDLDEVNDDYYSIINRGK